MQQTFRVRYSLAARGGPIRPADVQTTDTRGGLDLIPGQLPPGAYILSVEDLTGGRDVHWTRWPEAFRPGFGGESRRPAAQGSPPPGPDGGDR